jgi:methionine salvage enolase-phosphatase E1
VTQTAKEVVGFSSKDVLFPYRLALASLPQYVKNNKGKTQSENRDNQTRSDKTKRV